MWHNWIPWKYILRSVAQKKGFIDPISVLARFNAVSQPTQTVAPMELLRAGMVLHARGFINNNFIQHNLDWVWPFWVHKQFNPRDPAFIPRAFALTHINLTQRNWTAVGYPESPETPIVDGRGLLMPFFDSWSLDAWFMADNGETLIPSRMEKASQKLEMDGNLRVTTEFEKTGMHLKMCAEVVVEDGVPTCLLRLRAAADVSGWLVGSIRPYNPEGVSFVNKLVLLDDGRGWSINGVHKVHFSQPPDKHTLSAYRDGDVFLSLRSGEFKGATKVECQVGMATGAALYRVEAGGESEVTFKVPLMDSNKCEKLTFKAEEKWREANDSGVDFSGGPGRYPFLFAAAKSTVLLLSPREVFAGPYTYKRFWYRDAAIILHALMCAGHRQLSEKILDYFIDHQSANGYFRSQEGEWDSNGQVLWALGRYCRLFNVSPKPGWVAAIRKAVHWIIHKRLKPDSGKRHSELLPAGFSAEHLGPNDYYYWDDFWTISGLRLAEEMLSQTGNPETAVQASQEAELLSKAVDKSLKLVSEILHSVAMPASPYRRLDSGAVGSVAVGFPLQLWPSRDPRLLATLEFLYGHCFVKDAFYHDISHSGINPYLSLHIAQCLLRTGDPRFQKIMESIASLATSTGQWPEAIHPQLGTGCMGDGQHAWAAAEWIMMVRNCFLFEEEFSDKLILGAGLNPEWCAGGKPASFGPAPTRFGLVTVTLQVTGDEVELLWSGDWFAKPPEIEVRFPGHGWVAISKEPHRHVFQKVRM